jgi:hypothetical protein
MKNGCPCLLSLLPPVESRLLAVIVAGVLPSAFAQEKSDDELVKELANPIASLISVPFQNNFEFNLGPNNDGFKYTLNFQPVIPFSLNKDWNVIVRTIVPIIDQSDVIAPNTSQGGLSDITQSFFFSPKKPVAGMIVGAGPVFLYPSATDDLFGSEKWGSRPHDCAAQTRRPMDCGFVVQSYLVICRR